MIHNNNIQNNTNKTIIGSIPAQCPVYVINVKYLSKDNDPFYPIDRVIVHLLQDNPNASISYMAWILGFEKEIVDSRITHHLIEDGFLSYSPVSGNFHITDAGERKYLISGHDRPDVEVTGAVMVDGTTLELLPNIFYDMDNALRYFRAGKINVPHKPLLGINDPQLIEAVDRIEKKMRESHFFFGLEENGHDLQVIGYDERFIEDATVIITSDKDGNVSKELYYKEHIVNLPSVKGAVPKYYFYVDASGSLHQNHGVTSEENSARIICKSNPENLSKLFAKRYGIGDYSILNPNILTSKELSSQYPITLRVNSNLLSQAKYKRLLLADAQKKEICLSAIEGGSFFISIITDSVIDSYLEFELAIDDWKNKYNSIDMKFVEDVLSKKVHNWRSVFCAVDRYEDLETIDRKMYFKYV